LRHLPDASALVEPRHQDVPVVYWQPPHRRVERSKLFAFHVARTQPPLLRLSISGVALVGQASAFQHAQIIANVSRCVRQPTAQAVPAFRRLRVFAPKGEEYRLHDIISQRRITELPFGGSMNPANI
jgi:hypothetical protein